MSCHIFWRRAALCGLVLAQVRCASQQALAPNFVAQAGPLEQHGLLSVIDGTGYLSYHTPTAKDVPGYRFVRRVTGEVCQNDLQLPIALMGMHAAKAMSHVQALELLWGNAAVARGMADALRSAPPGAVLYDLTLDLHKISVFGLFFRRQCLVVSGSLALPQANPAPTAAGSKKPAAAPAAAADTMLPLPVATEPQDPSQWGAPGNKQHAAETLPLMPIPKPHVGKDAHRAHKTRLKSRSGHANKHRGGHTSGRARHHRNR